MDDELQNLEAELKRLRPLEPSSELIARIEGEIGSEKLGPRRASTTGADGNAGLRAARSDAAVETPTFRPGPSPMRWIWVAAFPAAASLIVVLWQFRPRTGTAALPPEIAAADVAALKPVRAENVLVEASDEGFVTMADGTRARRERLQFVDTIVWRDARTKASLTWSVPREEVRVVPIVFQ